MADTERRAAMRSEISAAMVEAACEVLYVNYKRARKNYRTECESEMRKALEAALASQGEQAARDALTTMADHYARQADVEGRSANEAAWLGQIASELRMLAAHQPVAPKIATCGVPHDDCAPIHPTRQFRMLCKLAARLSELLDEDHWAECEEMILAIEQGPWTSLAQPQAPAVADEDEDEDEAPVPSALDIAFAKGYADGIKDGERMAPAAAVPDGLQYTRDTVTTIVRSVCESEPSDPEHPDTVCISVLDLEAIVAAGLGCLILRDDPQISRNDRLLAALERAAAAESALRDLADECENDSVVGWEERMQQKILAANTLLAAARAPGVSNG